MLPVASYSETSYRKQSLHCVGTSTNHSLASLDRGRIGGVIDSTLLMMPIKQKAISITSGSSGYGYSLLSNNQYLGTNARRIEIAGQINRIRVRSNERAYSHLNRRRYHQFASHRTSSNPTIHTFNQLN